MSTKVDRHPQRDEIIKHLASEDMDLRAMEKVYGIARSTLHHYKQKYIPRKIISVPEQMKRDVQQEREQSELALQDTGQYIMHQIDKQVKFANKLQDACDEWLTDPKDPSKYTLDPRADEIEVIYDELVGDKLVRKRAPLSELVSRVRSDNKVPVDIKSKAADPRDLILRANNSMSKTMSLAAEIADQLRQSIQRSTEATEMDKLIDIILSVADDYPGLRERLEEAIEREG